MELGKEPSATKHSVFFMLKGYSYFTKMGFLFQLDLLLQSLTPLQCSLVFVPPTVNFTVLVCLIFTFDKVLYKCCFVSVLTNTVVSGCYFCCGRSQNKAEKQWSAESMLHPLIREGLSWSAF